MKFRLTTILKFAKSREKLEQSRFRIWAIHKLRHTLRGGGGRRSVTLCDKGGGILNFVTLHFKNSIKAILHG